jgi:uncharacterized protein
VTAVPPSNSRSPLPLDTLRRYAVARSLFTPTTLPCAVDRLGFVQADPIRAPARAQDLILRHRVAGYAAGDLERRYPRLSVEEDHLVNYGFLPRRLMPLLHPRTSLKDWDEATAGRAQQVLDFIRGRGPTHPREVEAELGHGRVKNYWGGLSNATTHLLDGMHHRSLLRVVRRESGTRVYDAVERAPGDGSPEARAVRAQALVDLVVRLYAPLPAASLGHLVTLLGHGAPHLKVESRAVAKASRERYAHQELDGTLWLWPADEDPASRRYRLEEDDLSVRLLAPFDPVVWDRRRFEMLWGWAYRFEAYTPAPRRKMGYYALPLLWRDQVIGWGNLRVEEGRLVAELGYVNAAPRSRAFKSALAAELSRMSQFLGL